MTGSLPMVGARAVILGMQAFNSNSRTVQSQLAAMGQSAYYLERTSARAFGGVGIGAASMAATVVKAVGVIAGALSTAAVASAVLASKYNQGVNFMGAVSEAASGQIATLDRAQLELSRHSTTTAFALTEMSTELVKAGFDIEQVTGQTLNAVNNLVIASNGELKAADAAIMAQVATANFGSSVENAANAATAAVQRSTLTFGGFATTMRQAGGVAANFGMDINEFSAAVGVMGLRLNQGSTIGTGFRTMLQRLMDPTEENITLMKQYGISLYDAEGNARPFRDVLVGLEDRFGDSAIAAGKLTQAQRDQAISQLFGVRASQAAIALLQGGVAAYDELLAATNRLTAAGLAGRVMMTSAAAAQMLRNNITALAISFGKGLDPAINAIYTRMVQFLQSIDLGKVEAFGAVIGEVLYTAVMGTADAMQILVERQSAVVVAYAELAEAILAVVNPLMFVTEASTGVSLSMHEINSAIFQLIDQGFQRLGQGVQVVIGWLYELAANTQAQLTFMVSVWNLAVGAIGNSINVAITAFFDFVNGLAAAAGHSGTLWQLMADVAVEFANALGGPVAGAIAGALGLIAQNSGQMAAAWDNAWSAMGSIVGRAVSWIASRINAWLDALSSLPIIGEAISGARAALGALGGTLGRMGVAIQGGLTTAANNASMALGRITLAAGNVGSALGKLFSPVQLKDYGAELRDITSKLRAVQDAAARGPRGGPLGEPVEGTEPGSWPGGDGGDGGAGKAAKKAAQDLANAVEKAHELVRDFNKDLENEARDAAEKVADLWEKASADIADAFREHDEAVSEAIIKAAEARMELDIEKSIQDDADSRREALDRQIDDEDRAREKSLNQAEIAHQRELDSVQRRLDAERTIRERNLEYRLEQESLARSRSSEDEDRIYEETLDAQRAALDKQLEQHTRNLDKQHQTTEDALERTHATIENELKLQHDVRERALDRELDQLEDALERELDAIKANLQERQRVEEEALEKRHDAARDELEARLDLEKNVWEDQRDLTKIDTTLTAARATAQAEYNRQVGIGVKQSIAQARMADAIAKAEADAAEQRARVTERRVEDTDEAAFDAQQDAIRLQQQAVFESETLELERQHLLQREALEAESDLRRLALEEASNLRRLELERILQAEMLALREQHEQAVTALREQHERDRDALEEAHQRQRRELDQKLQAESLKRQRQREDEDRQYREEQEATLRSFNAAEDARALREAQKLEDAEREREQKLEDEAREYRLDQEQRRRHLERTLDQEEHDRRISAINNEADERLRVLARTLEEETAQVQAKLASDIVDLRANMDERIATIRERYIDRLEDLVREGGAAINPLITEITDNMAAGLENVRQAAVETTEALAEALGAQNALREAEARRAAAPAPPSTGGGGGAGGGGFDWATYNFEKNMGASEADARARASRQYGGVVPGPFGAPVPIIAHGGERFEGMGGYSMGLTAVRAAEAAAARGIGAGTHIVNQYDYTVHANYGNVQPEGSVRRDLSALVAMTR